mmetsp:Transcript_37578/g.91183  ORF Transcript_37578/g.91183 Transcript_37578/m.91183 type:complete len:402 (+) Transcript_37578:72-1277(+)
MNKRPSPLQKHPLALEQERLDFLPKLLEVTNSMKSWNVPKLSSLSPNKRNKINGSSSSNLTWEILLAIPVWYGVGVGSICTTKMLLMKEYAVPPLVLTLQQLTVGSLLLRTHLFCTGRLQPLPKNLFSNTQTIYYDFVLTGLFNALDFLASNTCFSHSSASFVETMKASEPLMTTAIALFFGIDSLSGNEAICFLILISGVFCSTIANSSGSNRVDQNEFHQSMKTACIVMIANLCFALRAKSQKLFRAHVDSQKVNDENLLMHMEQIGAMSLVVPVIIFELPGVVERIVNSSLQTNWSYCLLAVTNAACFCTYCLASCFVLTNLSVVQYTCFNCLRRIFAVIFTAIVFGVPISMFGAFGIVLCFLGFISFTLVRNQKSMPPSIDSPTSILPLQMSMSREE